MYMFHTFFELINHSSLYILLVNLVQRQYGNDSILTTEYRYICAGQQMVDVDTLRVHASSLVQRRHRTIKDPVVSFLYCTSMLYAYTVGFNVLIETRNKLRKQAALYLK